MVAPGGFGDAPAPAGTKRVFAVINLKSRVVGVDTDKPRKELCQRFDNEYVKTQIISEAEYALRLEMAMYILGNGYEIFFL